MFTKLISIISFLLLFLGSTTAANASSATHVNSENSRLDKVSVTSIELDSWTILTNKVVSELNTVVSNFVNEYPPGSRPSSDAITDFNNKISNVYITNNFVNADYIDGALTEGLYWGETFNSENSYLSYVSNNISCISEIEPSIDSSNIFLKVSKIGCEETKKVAKNLATSETVLTAEALKRNALTIAAFNDSSVTPSIIAQTFNEATGSSVKPSKKFLKNKGVFKTKNYVVQSSRKNFYKISVKITLTNNYNYTCSFNFTGKKLKISQTVCS